MNEDEGMEEKDVSWVEGVLYGAFGALGYGVVLSSLVKSLKSCLGVMMRIFCFFDVLDMEVFDESMVDYGDVFWR